MKRGEVRAMVGQIFEKERSRIHGVLAEENRALRREVEGMHREMDTLDRLLKSWGDWNRKCFRS